MELAQFIDSLEFNSYEKKAILYLSSVDSSDAISLGKKAKIPQGRIYSVLNELKEKGIIEVVPSKPKKYKIENIKSSLNTYLQKHKADINEKIGGITSLELKPKALDFSPSSSVTYFSGREEHLNALINIRNTAKKEILQMAPIFIGTFASRLSLQHALERGVKVKILISGITQENKKKIQICLENGAEVRKIQSPELLSLTIKDSEELLLSIEDYTKKEERVVILSRSKSLLEAMRHTFFKLWKKSKKVELKDL